MAEGGDPTGGSYPLYISLIIAFVFVCLSALFSGLTLGLLSLDTTGLQVRIHLTVYK